MAEKDTKSPKWYPGKFVAGGSSKAPKSQEKIPKEVIQKSGYMFKRGSWMKSWKMRYFILRKDIHELQYCENADTTNVVLGSVPINSTTVLNKAAAADADGYSNAAIILTKVGKGPESQILVRFENVEQLEDWFKEINAMAKSKSESLEPTADNTVAIGTHLKEGWTCYGRKFYGKLAGRSTGTTSSSKPIFTDADINRQGYLYKRGTWFKSWKRRFFILRKDIHELHYFDDHLTMRVLGMITLDTNTLLIPMNEESEDSDGYPYVLRISSSVDPLHQKHNVLRFNTLDELEDWTRDIKAEAALVIAQRPSEMSGAAVLGGQSLDSYLKNLNQDIRSMKEELSNVAGNVVPSMSSQMNARADNIRQSTIGYESEVQRLRDEIARLNAQFRSLGLDATTAESTGDAEADALRNNLISEIDQAFTQITDEIQGLMVDRRATMVNSNMTTTSFQTCVNNKKLYKYTSTKGPSVVDPATVAESSIRDFNQIDYLPEGMPYATVTAQWILAESNEADDQNILGGTGKLMVMTDEDVIGVPVVTATEEFLSYYRAHLLQDGDFFRFETTREYPLFMMDIGENYLKEFIMKKKKGLYLEWHNEPHYHEPLNERTRGYYCLAREVPCDDEDLKDSEIPWKNFHMTCFRIPLGTACYSQPYAIHDDAPTIGEWRVGYIDADDFSTVTIFNCETGLIGFDFIQH